MLKKIQRLVRQINYIFSKRNVQKNNNGTTTTQRYTRKVINIVLITNHNGQWYTIGDFSRYSIKWNSKTFS